MTEEGVSLPFPFYSGRNFLSVISSFLHGDMYTNSKILEINLTKVQKLYIDNYKVLK